MSDDIHHKLQRIEDKIDKLDTRIDENNIILAKQSLILDEHQRRSIALEEQVDLFKQDFDARLEPVQEHVKDVKKSFSLLKSFFIYLGGFVTFLLSLFGLVKAIQSLL